MAQNQTGQPADVIAVKNNIPVLIDCKLCSNNCFPLSRIEPNQEAAMTLWELRGNHYCYFALKLSDSSIYMVDFDRLLSYDKSQLNEDDIRSYPTLQQWVEGNKLWR